jgi:hypothetical protein
MKGHLWYFRGNLANFCGFFFGGFRGLQFAFEENTIQDHVIALRENFINFLAMSNSLIDNGLMI